MRHDDPPNYAQNGSCQHCANARAVPVWIQVPLAIALTLALLMLASGHFDHCARDPLFCPAPVAVQVELPAAPSPAPAPIARPVMAHAYQALPLSLDNNHMTSYAMPPGARVQDMATHRGAIALDRINLIAVLQQGDARFALVRLPDGTVIRVRQGDRLDGGTVAAIEGNAVYLLHTDMTARALVLGG